MRSGLIAVVAALAMSVAACGGSGSPTATSHRGGVPGAHSRPSQIYRVALSGAAVRPPGPARAIGVALVALHGQSGLCWRFAHLHGFSDPIGAGVHSGTKGANGRQVVPLAPHAVFHHQGCARISPTLSRALAAGPSGYYIAIQSGRYPAGVVRGQL